MATFQVGRPIDGQWTTSRGRGVSIGFREVDVAGVLEAGVADQVWTLKEVVGLA